MKGNSFAMTPIHPSLDQCSLFKGISPDDLPALLQCLHATTKTYPEGSYIIHLGDEISQIGIVLSGRLELLKENASGNHTLITFLSPSQLFGEGIVCTSKRQSPVAVRAYEESEVLFFSYAHMIRSCGNACNFHTQLIHNMLLILGEKNYLLNT
ncbi:MAG: cyclic nucleotide-binding domain-containing protein, partial [Cellulosilyticaceae bacterium]